MDVVGDDERLAARPTLDVGTGRSHSSVAPVDPDLRLHEPATLARASAAVQRQDNNLPQPALLLSFRKRGR